MKKILILSANPINTDRLRLDEEVREIQSALERSRRRDQFELITRSAVGIDELRRALLDHEPQIVHFSGHGTGVNLLLDDSRQQQQRKLLPIPEQSAGIALENEFGQMQLVSTKSLTDLFERFKDTIECVLLNSCYSEIQAEEIYKHINCVIGMKSSIQDRAALNFSKGFYDAICAGRKYDDAFKFGCNNIDMNGITQALIPVIKIRQSLVLDSTKEEPFNHKQIENKINSEFRMPEPSRGQNQVNALSGINSDRSFLVVAVTSVIAFLGGGLIYYFTSQSQEVPVGNYQKTCINISVKDSILTGDCEDVHGHRITSSLEYKRCKSDIENINGRLECKFLQSLYSKFSYNYDSRNVG